MVKNEEEATIWNSLQALDERHRIVLVLRYYHELSISEISELLAIPEGTVHSRLHGAREKLVKALKPPDGE
jgi:RNA polymerase sigma-70 factor (ECF subfamily)